MSICKSDPECRRCGECCRWIAIHIAGMDKIPKATFDWFAARGVVVDGDYAVIPSVCPHLDYDEITSEATCDIQDRKPLVCKYYPGPGDWVPRGCKYGR